MKELSQYGFVNRRDYIIDQFEQLSLEPNEALVLMIIDYLRQNQIMVSHTILAGKLKKSVDEIEEILSTLISKGYLEIKIKEKGLEFSIDGIFEDRKTEQSFDVSLFDLFEQEFARPLSATEMERLSIWQRTYEKDLISCALREALTYNVLKFDYIEKILENWTNRGLTSEAYMRGER